jgi:hypothetical protein
LDGESGKGKGREEGDESESEAEIGAVKAESGGKMKVKGEKDRKVKEEEGSDVESSSGESGSEAWGSEDELPLAKLRKPKLGLVPPQQTLPTRQLGEDMRKVGAYGGAGGYEGAISGVASQGFMPGREMSVWEGMIPVGRVGIDSSFTVYGGWGHGFQSGIGWDQSLLATNGKPRKSV